MEELPLFAMVHMLTRRSFLASSAATAGSALLWPETAPAQEQTYDPTPQYVSVRREFLPGQMLIVPRAYYLYWVTEPKQAIRYGVGVGKAGLEFTGAATIDRKQKWPSWRPTNEMITRSPGTFARFKGNSYVQPGGPDNPLGARALYLYQNGVDTYFRIHGTNQPASIGQSWSNGCIRMLNDNVIDLYDRVPLGTMVTVL